MQVFDLPPRKFEFGLGFRSGFRIPFFFLEKGVVKLYYIQPRKSFSLDRTQLGFLATVHKRFLLDIEFFGSASDIEYVDVSAPSEGAPRLLKVYSLADLDLWDAAALEKRLSNIAAALRFIAEKNLTRARRVTERARPDMPLFD